MLVLLLAILAFANGVQGALNSTMTGDMYVFAYTWTPQYCYGTSYPGCKNPQPYWGDHFTMHGLWPEYSTGGYPQDCTNEPYDKASADYVGWDDMTKYWPEVEYNPTDPQYTKFWDHEWTKHGTCTGLSQNDYFQTTINLIKSFSTPDSLIKAADAKTTLSASTLRNDMGGPTYAILQCSGGKYLAGVYTCWNQENGFPTKQTACPKDVQASDTCTSSTLYIETF